MRAQLHAIADELGQATARLHRLRDALSEERWRARNDPARWSAAECVEHLNLTSAAMAPLLESGLEEARKLPATTARRLRRGFFGWLLWKYTGPESRGRMQTTAAFLPSGTPPAAAMVAADFERWQRKMLDLLSVADGLPIDRVEMTSPFNARMRYNLYAGFSVLPRHQHRHLQQAERVWPPE
jgi:hypothetical protein